MSIFISGKAKESLAFLFGPLHWLLLSNWTCTVVLFGFSNGIRGQQKENYIVDPGFNNLNSEYINSTDNYDIMSNWYDNFTGELALDTIVNNWFWTCSGSNHGYYANFVAQLRTNYLEIIVGELKESLELGSIYCLEFDVAVSPESEVFTDSLNITFDSKNHVLNPLTNSLRMFYAATPIFNVFIAEDLFEWKRVSIEFQASGFERFVYIGFFDNADHPFTPLRPVRLYDALAVCIDNVFLYNCTEGVEFSLPNVFTPNGDGENDVYAAEQFNVEKVEWVVLNRWGQVVHSGSAPQMEWDGRDLNSAQELAEGVYFIRATAYGIDGSSRTEQQTVHLMR